MEPVFDLDWEDGLLLIQKASQKETEELLMTRWIHGTGDSYQSQMSFNDFRVKMLKGVDTKEETPEETLAKVRKIINGG